MTNELSLTPELLEKAKSATSAAALLTLAQESGIVLTAEEAAVYYAKLHPETGALSDEELDNVAGGACANRCESCRRNSLKKFVNKEKKTHGYRCSACGFVKTYYD